FPEAAKEANAAFKEGHSKPIIRSFNVTLKLLISCRKRSGASLARNHAVSFYWKETDALNISIALLNGTMRRKFNLLLSRRFLHFFSSKEVSILLVDFYKELFGSTKEVHPIDEDVVTNDIFENGRRPYLDIEMKGSGPDALPLSSSSMGRLSDAVEPSNSFVTGSSRIESHTRPLTKGHGPRVDFSRRAD
ncbi:hypothetical protein Leryth_024857, partial [Lithospermum erythrorhizon]